MKHSIIFQLEFNFVKFFRVHSEILTKYQNELRNNSIEINKQDIAETLISLMTESGKDSVILNYGTSCFPLPLKWFKTAINSIIYDIKINGKVFKSNNFPFEYTKLLKYYSINDTDKYTIRLQVINSTLKENEDFFNVEESNYTNWVFRYSKDVNEIKSAYIIEQQSAPYQKLLDWQKEALLSKFTQKSYVMYLDGGDFILPMLKKLVLSDKGQTFDNFVNNWQMDYGKEIEPCSVASFLYDVYSGTIIIRKTSDLMLSLARKYKTLSGKTLLNKFKDVKETVIINNEIEYPY